jgi:hypothetical protein
MKSLAAVDVTGTSIGGPWNIFRKNLPGRDVVQQFLLDSYVRKWTGEVLAMRSKSGRPCARLQEFWFRGASSTSKEFRFLPSPILSATCLEHVPVDPL